MSKRYDNIKRPKPQDTELEILQNLGILPENSAEGLGSRREHCWCYVVSVFQNTSKNLVVQGRVQLVHISHIFKVGVETTCYTSIPDEYWRKWLNQRAHLELCNRNPDILERVLNRIALSNSTAGKYAPKQVIKQPEHENFNNWGTKMILLSYVLSLVANNFKSFPNGSKSIIKHNLGLCKNFEIYVV